jgi:prepilin-type N-terminal cleavage/methylation domain-containing protein
MKSSGSGFTLVEMLIGMLIILVVILGLIQAALLSIDNNVRNLLRDEAVRISEQAMTGELVDTGGTKHEGLKNLPVDNDHLPTGVWPMFVVERDFRGLKKAYTVRVSVTNLAGSSAKKSLQVTVGWDHKNESPPKAETGREFQHSITSIVVSAL